MKRLAIEFAVVLLVGAAVFLLLRQGEAQTTSGYIVAPDSMRANKGIYVGGDFVTKIKRGSFTLDPPSVLAAISLDATVSVSGLDAGSSWTVVVQPASDFTAGLLLTSARVSADDTIKLRFGNLTALPIDQGSTTFNYVAFK